MTEQPRPSDDVTLTIDGVTVTVPKGTLVIRAAEQVGIEIPRFCDHPLLAPAGACRQCLVEVALPGPDGEMRQMQGPPGRMKPQASCTLTASEGMEVRTQATSPGAEKAQRGVMELLLINHPLDCPVCDKGGECPLQNQAMSVGRGESRFAAQGMTKRTFEKPISLSPQILLDRERCIVCQRCTRFSDEIAGDPFISLVERGAQQQIGIAPEAPFLSYFAGNTVQICPVGALTSVDYRFRARPFDLVSTPSVAEHDACGAAIRVDHRRGKVVRRLSGDDAEVNQEWITDKDRFAFSYTRASRRITHPWVRDTAPNSVAPNSVAPNSVGPDGGRGELRPASWPEAIARAAAALGAGPVGVLTGGRMPVEDAFAWSKFARTVLRTDDVDFRSRPGSAEEAWFLSEHVAGRLAETQVPSYADLERAGTVVLAGLDPEEEAGTLFLRLRSAVQQHGTRVVAVAPFTSRGLTKLDAELRHTVPGQEAATIEALEVTADDVVLVGERLATSPGAFAAVAALVARTGARLAWVPRRAGDRGAVEVGLLPGLLPGGRRLDDADDRALFAAAFGALPDAVGRDLAGIVDAARDGRIAALLIGGVDPDDTADPAAFRAALSRVDHLVSLELTWSDVASSADVVLPIAPVTDREGTFLTWDARERGFEQIFDVPGSLPEWRVLAEIADAMGRPLGWASVDAVQEEIASLVGAAEPSGGRAAPAPVAAVPQPVGRFVLATHRHLVDHASLLAGQDALLATMRPAVVAMAAGDLADLGLRPGALVDVAGDRGTWTLPCAVADLPAGVVWVPTRSHGRGVWAELAAPGHGVDVRRHVPAASGTELPGETELQGEVAP